MSADTPDPRPWERQPDETNPAYAAFETYLRAGAGRSVTKVAAECNKSRSLLNRWSARHKWVRRAQAWDADLNREYLGEVIEARRTLAHRHLAVSRTALEKVAAAVAGIDPSGLTVAETARLWDLATRTEREALQVPTRVELSGPGGGPIGVMAHLTDEERHTRLRALRREIDERLEVTERPHHHDDTDTDSDTEGDDTTDED
ncbi:hypothetical protein FE634_15475 [Nocardioides dongxiaopingii]|uniref:hypothetical protein n=1 Tax=Nocardioides sp. S-1144 TaxID=2582905 RepID=UPI00110E3E58|nr:hypothetical protein [Nocardioides sp. S-1144]QCW51459.1 hypothetical protein FE634_15475 [Nocardioides sp. S-1144]